MPQFARAAGRFHQIPCNLLGHVFVESIMMGSPEAMFASATRRIAMMWPVLGS
jgi:hypothetical protein